jgi:translation initiation factor 4A
MKVSTHCSIGGTRIRDERDALKLKPQIIVGTPGRVLDMMSKEYILTDSLLIFCLDEADEILGRGFQEEIDEIFKKLPGDIQILLFSATMPPYILELTQ